MFWATVTSNGLPYAVGPLSCLSVTLVYFAQKVGLMKMPLGTEVDLGPCDIVLDGDPAAPKKGSQHPLPNFGPCLLWPNGRPSQLLLSTCFYNSSALTEMGDRGHSSVGCHFSA